MWLISNIGLIHLCLKGFVQFFHLKSLFYRLRVFIILSTCSYVLHNTLQISSPLSHKQIGAAGKHVTYKIHTSLSWNTMTPSISTKSCTHTHTDTLTWKHPHKTNTTYCTSKRQASVSSASQWFMEYIWPDKHNDTHSITQTQPGQYLALSQWLQW